MLARTSNSRAGFSLSSGMEAQRAAKTHGGLKTQELGSSNDVKDLSLSYNIMYPVTTDLSRKKNNLF